MTSSPLPGKIITFYSYKGGTGRSMTLANVAWLLASAGKRVLVMDWDLEAPGLHRYFHPFLQDKELTSSEGIIDFVIEFAAKAVTPAPERDDDWYLPYTNIRRYASSLSWDFGAGTLDFVPAGRQGPDYATRVNSFNWEKFYNRLGGGIFLEAAKRSMAGYDYVLIDSRTGVSDTSGICTVQMPDLLVVCFTYNTQGIEGAAAVAESAVLQRQKPDGGSGLLVLPVPMRVEMAEKEKLDLARELAQERFDPFLSHLTSQQQKDLYWGGVEILYQPFYAYEEVLATFGDKPLQTKSLLASMEVLTSYITNGKVARMASLSEPKRQEVLARYARQRKPAKAAAGPAESRFWFYFSYARRDNDPYLQKFFADLQAEVQRGLGLKEKIGFFDASSFAPGDDWQAELAEALRSSRSLVSLLSPYYVRSEFCGKEVQIFLQRSELQLPGSTRRETGIFPVLWIPLRQNVPGALADIQWLDAALPKAYITEGLRYLMRLKRFRDDYEEFLFRFAAALIKGAESNDLPVLEYLPQLRKIPNAFEESRGRVPSVEFLYAAATRREIGEVRKNVESYGDSGSRWRPFFPSVQAEVALLTQSIAAEGNFLSAGVDLEGDDILQRVKEADREGRVVVVLIDPWTLRLERYRKLLLQVRELGTPNLLTFFLLNFEDKETRGAHVHLEHLIRVTFGEPSLEGIESRSFEEFRSGLQRALVMARRRIMERASIPRLPVDETLAKRPILRGPDKEPR